MQRNRSVPSREKNNLNHIEGSRLTHDQTRYIFETNTISVPFIIEDNLKMFCYRGLKEWNSEKGYLTDICLIAQDKYKAYLDC